MKVTFPHLGNVHLAMKSLFNDLGIECIVAPLNNKLSLEIGSLHSPEEICLPFKIMIGNYIQAIEKGADTIIIAGSCGPCRFGEYCELQMNLLKRLGYKVDFIVIDSPGDIGIKEFFRRLNKISHNSDKNRYHQLKALKNAFKVIEIMDEIEAKAYYLAGFEKNKGDFKRYLNSVRKKAIKCNNSKEMLEMLIKSKENISKIEVSSNKNPIKIAIIGEIYTVIEPFTNMHIEEKLMDYGVSTKRRLTLSWWVKNMILSRLKLNSRDINRSARGYLGLQIGGYAKECIGEAVLSHEEGLDGAIQVFPVGCMPEIVSKSILPKISKDKNYPIMSLVVDEMTGEAGLVTRIEAFIDLLERKRDNVLSGS